MYVQLSYDTLSPTRNEIATIFAGLFTNRSPVVCPKPRPCMKRKPAVSPCFCAGRQRPSAQTGIRQTARFGCPIMPPTQPASISRLDHSLLRTAPKTKDAPTQWDVFFRRHTALCPLRLDELALEGAHFFHKLVELGDVHLLGGIGQGDGRVRMHFGHDAVGADRQGRFGARDEQIAPPR